MVKKRSAKPGEKYGKLTVISQAGLKRQGGSNHKLWLCSCECGGTKETVTFRLRNGTTKSCGCLASENCRKQAEANRKPPTVRAVYNALYGETKRGATFRYLDFELTKDQYIEIVTRNCFYCGDPPRMRSRPSLKIEVPAHGVDRVDNNSGYTISNCVSCCEICNRIKLDLEMDTLLNHMSKIIINLIRRTNGTQLEHMKVALACKKIFVEKFPIISEALEWKGG